MERQEKCEVIQQLTPRTGARTRYQLSINLLHLDLTVSIRIRHVFIVKSTNIDIFTALHEMQTRSSDENSVCLSCQMRAL